MGIGDLPEGWSATALTIYSVGGSDEEVMAELGLSREDWKDLVDEDGYFKETIEQGKLAAYAWWLRWGRENLNEKGANYSGWYNNMKCRFGWKEGMSMDSSAFEELENMDTNQLHTLMVSKIKLLDDFVSRQEPDSNVVKV